MPPEEAPEPLQSFDPQKYWQNRLSTQFSLEGVGWQGMSEPFNRWMYQVRRAVFVRELGPLVDARRRATALDVGSGTGVYVDLWHKLGVDTVLASDFTDVAVRELSARYGENNVVKLDISDRDDVSLLGSESFDFVSAMDMLFHIVDDAAYERAVDNLAYLLKPGGLMVFTENFMHGPEIRSDSQVSRTFAAIESLFRAAGLERLRYRPAFLLMNTPVDSSSRVLHFWWRYLADFVHRGPRVANALGAALYLPEITALRLVRTGGPSTKLAIWRKPLGPPGGRSAGSG